MCIRDSETVFAFNGMGRVAVTSIQYLDFVVIMGVTLITSVIFLLSNLIVDITYAIIDPRVRLECGAGTMVREIAMRAADACERRYPNPRATSAVVGRSIAALC